MCSIMSYSTGLSVTLRAKAGRMYLPGLHNPGLPLVIQHHLRRIYRKGYSLWERKQYPIEWKE